MSSADQFIRTVFFLACALLFSVPGARAEYIETMELGLQTGYRTDKLNWNIAGTMAGTSPNVLSELTWKDLEIYQVGAAGKMAVGSTDVKYFTYLRGHFKYGWIQDGKVQDSDYVGNNRTLEYSRSNNLTKGDHVLDGSLGLGLQWRYPRKRASLALLGGYSHHEQNLRITDGRQTLSRPDLVPGTPPVGAIAGLNSTYETRWRGPWAGIDLEFNPFSRFSLLTTFEYHWARYRAEADWNLRSDFAHPVSFRHESSDARGLVLQASGRYLLSSRWGLDLTVDYQDWEAEGGIDSTFGADGSTGAQKLNQVNWQSTAASLGLTYLF